MAFAGIRAMYQETINFRDTFASRASGETVRAFSIFGLLLAALIFIVVQLAFRELSLQVLTERIDLGRAEAILPVRALSASVKSSRSEWAIYSLARRTVPRVR